MSVQYNHPAPMQNGDLVAQLPFDQIPATLPEIQVIDTLFKNHGDSMKTIGNEYKDSLLVMILLILFSLPQIDSIINKFFPISVNSPYALLGIKALCAGILFWLVKHFYLSRK